MNGHRFFPRFGLLIAHADDAEFRMPEDSALIGVANDLAPRVSRLLRDSLELLGEVEVAVASALAADPEPPGGEGDDAESLAGIARMIASDVAAREIADLVFFAIGELRAALDELERALTHDRVLMTARLCESGLRSALRALVSVEAALYRFEDEEPPERQWVDLEVSLEIRRLYRDLRRELAQRSESREEGWHEDVLRAVMYRLLAFRELRIYPFLRVDDRVQLRALLKRMLDWLNSPRRDPDVARGLWRDLRQLAQILAQVSYRQELREHDRRVLARAHGMLFGRRGPAGTDPPRAVPWAVLDELRAVLGLDDELDALIEAPDPAPLFLWRAPILRLLDELRR